jgi:hypothetical protein
MFARNNVVVALPPVAVIREGYEHIRSTGIFHLAELDNRIVAVAGATLRDGQWFLSAFWALPEVQRNKLGMPLLRQIWQAGVNAGAKVFYTWSSIDITAMASYLKLSMFPGYEILLFEGEPLRFPGAPEGYTSCEFDLHRATELDAVVRAARHAADLHFLISKLKIPAKQVNFNGEFIGYYLVNRGGIGPVAWTDPQHGVAVLSLAAQEARATSPSIRVAVLGINHLALQFALDSGLRLASFAHFMTSASFGRLEQYVPWAPLLF